MTPKSTNRRPKPEHMTGTDDGVVAAHWESVWTSKAPEINSWFEASPTTSLELIKRHAAPPRSAIDIGGGSSPLTRCLYQEGFRDLSVLDVSHAALTESRANFADHSGDITWIVADMNQWTPKRTYDIWHDRAAFHFLVAEEQVQRYAQTCGAAVAPGGLLVIGTFDLDGPASCSGLPVQRRSISTLMACFESDFVAIDATETTHITPSGTRQSFVFIAARRMAPVE